VSETALRRWKKRATVADGSHTPKRLAIGLTRVEEEPVCELRRKLDLPLDGIVEVRRRCACTRA